MLINWFGLALTVAVAFGFPIPKGDISWNYRYYPLDSYLNRNTGARNNEDGRQFSSSKQGTYHFRYDTGYGKEQSFRGETRGPDGTVTGYYGYVDPDGVLRITEYIADRLGFRAKTTLRYRVID